MKMVTRFIYIKLLCVFVARSCVNGLTVGILLGQSTHQEQSIINDTISKKYSNGEIIFSSNIHRVSEIDSYGVSEIMCQMMNNGSGLVGIIGPELSVSTMILESISSEFQIPYILTSWKSSPSTLKSDSTINFFPEASLFSLSLSEIVKSFGWKSFIVLYDNDVALKKLEYLLVLQKYDREDTRNRIIIEKLGPGPNYKKLFEKIQASTLTNVILDCRLEYVISILQQAKSFDMLNAVNNYFITNLDAHTLDYSELNTKANITTITLIDDNYEHMKENMYKMGLEKLQYKKFKTDLMLFYDAFWFFNETLNELGPTVITNAISCDGRETSPSGKMLVDFMQKKSSTLTFTGPVSFDDHGNRKSFNLFVTDVLRQKKLANWFSENKTLHVIETSDEKWMSIQGTKVIVSSKLGAPYLSLRQTEKGEILEGNARFEGYTFDLVAEIAKIIGFEFEIMLTKDGRYGYYDENKGKWNGIIGDILEKRAQLGIADLTITHQRREVVDFSLPFMSLGIGILHTKSDDTETQMIEFLKPFSDSVWIYSGYLLVFMTICLYFVIKCSSQPSIEENAENIWNMKHCIWIVFRSLTGYSCEIVPKSLSAKIAMTVWWFFCTTLSCFYIANLAAYLSTSDESSLKNVEDLAKQSSIKYGVLSGGSTEAFFRNSNISTYQRMWYHMKQNQDNFVSSNQEGVEKVIITKNSEYAFLMESTQIEYELENNCNLKQVGDWLDSKSYGIAMPLNAPYRTAVNKAILKMQESGYLTDLKKKWWKTKQGKTYCSDSGEDENLGKYELTLLDVAGIFLILWLGICLSLTLAILGFLWNIRRISLNQKLPYCEILMQELKFATFIWTSNRRNNSIQS